MNKNELNVIVKFIAELDKKIAEDNQRWNEPQKEIIKAFIDCCYDEFKKENNIK